MLEAEDAPMNVVCYFDRRFPRFSEYSGLGMNELGRVSFCETGYLGDTMVVKVTLGIHPDDAGVSLIETLRRQSEAIAKANMYLEILGSFRQDDRYLGGWQTEEYPLRRQVTEYLKRGYEYIQDRWGVVIEEICSDCRVRRVSRTRGSLMYALNRKFPHVGKSGLSTVDIGSIFNKDHSTVILVLKTIRERMNELGGGEQGKSKIGSADLVELLIDEGVATLGGIKGIR